MNRGTGGRGGRLAGCLLLVGLSACETPRDLDVAPDPARDAARLAGTTRAVDVASAAGRFARAASRAVPTACRGPLPGGAVAVSTIIEYGVRDAGGGDRIRETRTWRRDADGNVAQVTHLGFAHPDGRWMERSRETRIVGDRAWRALDGRFVAADRVPGIIEETRVPDRRGADLLWSYWRWDGARIAPVAEGGICPADPAAVLGPPEAGEIVAQPGVRGGWARWTDRVDGRVLTIRVTETIVTPVEAVTPPDAVFDVDAADDYRRTHSLLDAAIRDGHVLRPDGAIR